MSRPARLLPRDLARDWPTARGDDPVGEVARRFALNLRDAIGDRSLRATAEATGVNHTTVLAVLEGRSWPDLATIAKLELGLGVSLWPGSGEVAGK
jgi:transcriptional regulator with XRE-family HTH domain